MQTTIWLREPERMDGEVCKTCVHYYQHYVINHRGHFTETNAGHCARRHIKDRNDNCTCANYERRHT